MWQGLALLRRLVCPTSLSCACSHDIRRHSPCSAVAASGLCPPMPLPAGV